MRAVLLSLVALALIGCGPSESEKAAQAAREHISAAARADWSGGIDAAKLAESLRLCAEVQSLDCIKVKARVQAAADAITSCSGNDSALCQAVSNTKSLHQFKGGAATPLPAHPFYWSIGNELLDAQASTFSYRGEMWDGWLDRWRVVLLSVLGALIATVCGWLWWSWREAEAEEKAQADADRKAQEARQRAAHEYAKAEATRRAQDAQAKAVAQRAEENAAKTAQAAQDARASAEEAAQAEVQQVKEATAAALKAAFSKPKR